MTTAQSILDQVTEHLFKQGVAAIDPEGGNCAYRTKDGLMCAVGCLLDDDAYEQRFEGHGLAGLFNEFDEEELPSLFRDHYDLLSQLQTVHDHEMPRYKLEDCEEETSKEIYHEDMMKVVKELRLVASVHQLQLNENLIPEQYRHAD